jgi:hypothetical protein
LLQNHPTRPLEPVQDRNARPPFPGCAVHHPPIQQASFDGCFLPSYLSITSHFT